MTHPRLRVTVLICCAFLCGIILTSIVIYLKPTERLSHFDPSLGSGTVHFEGFVAPGSENQQELELLAKSGIDVQGPTGIVKPVIIDIKPGEDPPVIDPKNDQSIPVAILSTTQFNA